MVVLLAIVVATLVVVKQEEAYLTSANLLFHIFITTVLSPFTGFNVILNGVKDQFLLLVSFH